MEKTVLTKNGLAVHSYKNPKISGFAISLFIKTGPMYEEENENGFAHFFEHIVFRNINSIMGGELYETLDRYGLYFNAATFLNYIEFTVSGSEKHFDKAAKIISLVLSPFVLPTPEINMEKKRIKAEIREDIDSSLDRFCDGEVFAGTPLSRPITGRCPDIDRFGIKKLVSERKRFLTKENMFFYVGGNFSDSSLKKLCELIEKQDVFLGKQFSNIAPIPNGFQKRNLAVIVKNAPATSVKISFDIKNYDFTPAEIFCLADTLFSGESCPMYRELSENTGLIYSYDDDVICFDNISFLTVSYDVKADRLIKSLDLVLKMFSKAKTEAEKRLPLVIPAYTDNAYLTLDNAESIASNFGYYNHILSCKYFSVEEKIKAFSEISPERISLLASKVFNPDNLVIAIKGNKKKINVSEIKKLALDSFK